MSLAPDAPDLHRPGRGHPAPGRAAFTGDVPWLERVRAIVHQTVSAPLRIADLARQFGVHRVHLGRAFRERYGISLGAYHRRIRVAWAAEQLARGDAPVGRIAARAGFADHGHFTRVFKSVMGTTPRVYRARRAAGE